MDDPVIEPDLALCLVRPLPVNLDLYLFNNTHTLNYVIYSYLCFNYYSISMCKEKLITGVKVSEQMRKANEILHKQVIPKDTLYKERKKDGQLSRELLNSLKSNA